MLVGDANDPGAGAAVDADRPAALASPVLVAGREDEAAAALAAADDLLTVDRMLYERRRRFSFASSAPIGLLPGIVPQTPFEMIGVPRLRSERWPSALALSGDA